jgi:HD superfamily phosphodiesterase
VTALALRLARALKADLEIVEAAGWLHDVRKGEPAHAIVGAAAARTILTTTDFPPAKIEAVVDAISKHEGLFRKAGEAPLEPLEAAILWDADKLSKLGVQSVLISLSTPHVFGKDMAERWRYVAEFADQVLGRTVESMNTKAARRMAERRYRSTLALLSLWAREAREAGLDLQGEFQFEISFDYDGLSEE